VIGDDDQDDTDHSSIPHTKLKYVHDYSFLYFFFLRHLIINRPDRLIITTTGKGRLLDTSEEKRLQQPGADLFVYLNAAHLFSV
jgi:hypothetical protein